MTFHVTYTALTGLAKLIPVANSTQKSCKEFARSLRRIDSLKGPSPSDSRDVLNCTELNVKFQAGAPGELRPPSRRIRSESISEI